MTNVDLKDDGKIVCALDGARVHVIKNHLRDYHPNVSVQEYKERFPGEPLLSQKAMQQYERIKREKALAGKTASANDSNQERPPVERRPVADLFGLNGKINDNPRGEIPLASYLNRIDEAARGYVPDVDPNYVFNLDLLKSVLIGFEINKSVYFWGYHGTGKTSIGEQVCARTGRPWLRVQHTINTEEAHVIGQYIVKDGETQFQLGPLPHAMLHGLVYCADEYDVALPSVCALYQPVLEGKPLIIKDAPPEYRIIRPHPDFRFFATGNTNGSGDETGLYQGTQIQNAANYSRFAITEEVGYMEPKMEISVLSQQANIGTSDATRFVEFAGEVRKAFMSGKISSTISPRELINAAQIALVRGSDWRAGLRNAFSARLSRTDREVIDQYAQRIFG